MFHHHGPLEVRHGAGYCVQTLEPSHVAGQCRKLSPSSELMVDPGRGARCGIRDAAAFDETDPVAAGRIGGLREARAEGALLAYVEGRDWPSGSGIRGNGCRITGRLFWCVRDAMIEESRAVTPARPVAPLRPSDRACRSPR
jgi:hypothetical protein